MVYRPAQQAKQAEGTRHKKAEFALFHAAAGVKFYHGS
jgi:hypothetical protein